MGTPTSSHAWCGAHPRRTFSQGCAGILSRKTVHVTSWNLKISITAGGTRAWTHTPDSSDSWRLLSWEKSNLFSASWIFQVQCHFNELSEILWSFPKTYPLAKKTLYAPQGYHSTENSPRNCWEVGVPRTFTICTWLRQIFRKLPYEKEVPQAPTSWSTPSLPVNNGCPKISSAKTSWSVGKKNNRTGGNKDVVFG